ncbi:hypothetical protein FJ414_13890 [Mesorhizobium sp. B3-1-6]|nr:hypothetical protein FJ414_13890 [Mesorhizobium sp. B3-1-6]
MSRKSVQRFCDNDMHENKGLKARRQNPLQRDALLKQFQEKHRELERFGASAKRSLAKRRLEPQTGCSPTAPSSRDISMSRATAHGAISAKNAVTSRKSDRARSNPLWS